MQRDRVVKLLEDNREQWEPFGVRSLGLFGSVARDEAGQQSDIDILVEFEPPATFDRYADLHQVLEQLLGCDVDLLTTGAIQSRFRPYVEEDLLEIA